MIIDVSFHHSDPSVKSARRVNLGDPSRFLLHLLLFLELAKPHTMAENQPPPQTTEVEHPPHVHRLLRLVREGTSSHASRASVLLGRYAASCCVGVVTDGDGGEPTPDGGTNSHTCKSNATSSINSSVIIWDLIGRLVAGDGNTASTTKRKSGGNNTSSSGLFDPNWETRENSASALEAVARCLPLEDRRSFFEGSDDPVKSESEGDVRVQTDESLLWLSVDDLHKQLNETVNRESNTPQQRPNQLDVVVERGRLLLSSSGERYDWNSKDDEAQEYVRENESLQRLDATAFATDNATETKNLHQSFLRQRVILQRQILAKRLGLGGILSAPIVTENNKQRFVDEMVGDEDLISDTVQSSNVTISTETVRERSIKRLKKRRRVEDATNSDQESNASSSIRALLVLESKRCTMGIASDDFTTQNHKTSQHHNPQTLLGSELAYRTFDPQWTVRHGALLGTLALLRAWRVHDFNIQHKRAFGRWPHDILARCTCILSLDQFADYGSNSIDSQSSSELVAPVREMASQIVAVLLEAAPSEVWECVHDLLLQLYTKVHDNQSIGWQNRLGVLMAWKYICAMVQMRSSKASLVPSAMASNLFHFSTYDMILRHSISGLSDSSDDVRAASAETILQLTKSDKYLHTINIAKECTKPLWEAIVDIREGVSSCATSLLSLLAEILSKNCSSSLPELEGCTPVLQTLSGFISYESVHVKISCFRSLCLVLRPMVKDVVGSCSSKTSDSDEQPIIELISTLCRLLESLFDTHFAHDYFIDVDEFLCNNIDGGTQSNPIALTRDQAWREALASLSLAIDGLDASRDLDIIQTTVSMSLRYFGIRRSSPSHGTDQANIFFDRRVDDSNGNGDISAEQSYCSKLTASRALALFYENICTRPNAFSSIIMRTFITRTIEAILQSPWTSQCEAGFLLHNALTDLTNKDKTRSEPHFTGYFQILLSTFSVTVNCILTENDVTASSIANEAKVKSLCDSALGTELDRMLKATHVEGCSQPAPTMTQVWWKVFNDRGVSFDALQKSPPPSLTKSSMRLLASASGAIVKCGSNFLPHKVTPIIRALMTSLKNEESTPRRLETCRYIAELVVILSEDSLLHKARNKLVENVFRLALGEYNGLRGEPTISSHAAKYTLESIVASASSNDTLQSFPAIWERAALLLKDDVSVTSESMFMLSIISKVITKESLSFTLVVDLFLVPSVAVACSCDSEFVRKEASSSIINLCKVDFGICMNKVIPSLLPILTNLQDDTGRKGGCKLLLSLLRGFGVAASPFVIELLPISMRLMTDSTEECSQLAASSFSILVRIAPLSAGYIGQGKTQQTNESQDDASEDVVRHLILGKPLPPCILPEAVSIELSERGIALRQYQIEGISWLKFLRDVHLNGALCDDMG